MADNDDGAEKSFDASPERLRQARRDGNVPQSPELLTFARYTGVLIAVMALVGAVSQSASLSLSGFFNSPYEAAGFLMDGGQVIDVFGPTAILFFSIVGFAMVLAVVALVVQQAITFSPKKIKPDFSKVSILKNAKNKYGPVGLIDFAKALVKVTAVMTVGTFIGIFKLPDMLAAVGAPAGFMAPQMMQLTLDMLIAAVLLAAVASAVDVPVKWGQHAEKLRMSRQEMLDEAKDMEGDPNQKSARAAMAREIANNRQLADVPTADVVIVNPEHYAVALKWNRHANEVPRCVAKGVDHVALKIRETAEEAGVPVYRDVPTARALHATIDVGDEIRHEQYSAVAAAIRFSDGLRNAAKK